MVEARGLLYAGALSLLLIGCEATPGTGPTPVIPAVLGSQTGSVNHGLELSFDPLSADRVRVTRVNGETFLITTSFLSSGHTTRGLSRGVEYLRERGCQIARIESNSPDILIATLSQGTRCAAEIS